MAELQNYRTTEELQNYRTTELQNYRTTELQNYRTTTLFHNYWYICCFSVGLPIASVIPHPICHSHTIIFRIRANPPNRSSRRVVLEQLASSPLQQKVSRCP